MNYFSAHQSIRKKNIIKQIFPKYFSSPFSYQNLHENSKNTHTYNIEDSGEKFSHEKFFMKRTKILHTIHLPQNT